MSTPVSMVSGLERVQHDQPPGNKSNDHLRIIFLNAWSGILGNEISRFMEEQAAVTSVFCLQEVDEAMVGICKTILSDDFEEISAYKKNNESDFFPSATYVRKDRDIIASNPLFHDRKDVGLAIQTEIAFGDGSLHICNVHGVSRPNSKQDNPARKEQSAELIKPYAHIEDPVIIGGDFNLFPDTESIQAFQANGYRDLIQEYGIQTTRNHYAWERFPDTPHYFSDYVFVKGGISVTRFSVLDDEVADHLPMLLEVEAQ